MKKLIEFLEARYDKFEAWFNAKFGWFMTNGNKVDTGDDLL
jgi:hypothetical protein